MEPIDRVVLGDNQFFGINHMSQEKAQQQAERFRDIGAVTRIYEVAVEAGIRAVMLNSNERASGICEFFRTHRQRFADVAWYPSIPYPHKYANLVAEKGVLGAVKEVLWSDNGAVGVLGLISRGSIAVLGRDEIKVMQMLVDIEMRAFRGLAVRAIFLQNVVTDLILGLGLGTVLREYCDYVRRKYRVLPGLITQNMPRLLELLAAEEIGEVVVCTSFNKLGYLMSPDVESYIEAAQRNDPQRYQIMAMSTLASGALSAREGYGFIKSQQVQSVVFGASSETNIRESLRLITGGSGISSGV